MDAFSKMWRWTKERCAAPGGAGGLFLAWRTWFRIGLVFAFAAAMASYVVLCEHYVRYSALASEEAYQPLAAREALAGKMPYLDFAYPEMPLSPYLAGAVMTVSGFGVLEQRVLGAVMGGLALLCAAFAVFSRTGSPFAGALAIFVVGVSPHWVASEARASTHGASTLFLSLAFAAACARFAGRRRAVVFGLAAGLAVSCELRTAILALPIGLLLLVDLEGWRPRLWAVGAALVTLAACLLPFVLSAPEVFWYFNWTSARSSEVDRHSMYLAVDWWRMSPGAILTVSMALVGLPVLIRRREWVACAILLLGVMGLTLPLVPASSHAHYLSPFLPVAAAAAVIAMWSVRGEHASPLKYAVVFFPAIALLYPTPDTIVIDEGATAEIGQVGDAIRASARPGPVLTPVTAVAVAAGRGVVSGTELGMFAVMDPGERALARRMGLTTLPELTALLKRKAIPAVVRMQGVSDWNFRVAVPGMEPQPKDARAAFERELRLRYRTMSQFATMEVLVPE